MAEFHELLTPENNENWRPIFSDSSLPHYPGQVFLVRSNKCSCKGWDKRSSEALKTTCLKIDNCVKLIKVVKEFYRFREKVPENDVMYIRMDKKGSSKKSRKSLVMFNAYFKLIHPESYRHLEELDQW